MPARPTAACRQIAAVTAADVQRVAREWLAPESAVTFTYTQGSGEPATYANPAPMPALRHRARRRSASRRKLNDEATRQAPPPPGAVPAVARAEIVESRLANGIRLVAAQTGSVPLATMTVVLPGGTATDPRGQGGHRRARRGARRQGHADPLGRADRRDARKPRRER